MTENMILKLRANQNKKIDENLLTKQIFIC